MAMLVFNVDMIELKCAEKKEEKPREENERKNYAITFLSNDDRRTSLGDEYGSESSAQLINFRNP